MPSIVDVGATGWPCRADLPGRRLQAHEKMVLLHTYLTTLGLARVRFAGDYDVEGDETQIPAYVDRTTVDLKSPWMRFDWNGGMLDRNNISLYFCVHLAKYYNNSNTGGDNAYMLATSVRGSASDADPWGEPNFVRSAPPGSLTSSSLNMYTLESRASDGDFALAAANRLFMSFCTRSICDRSNPLLNNLTWRSALNLYIERFDEYDLVQLENTGYSGATMVGSPQVFDSAGTKIGAAFSAFAFPDGVSARAGVPVIQKLPVYNGPEYIETQHAFLAPRSSFPAQTFKRLDFSGEEKPYFSVWSESYRPNGSDNLVRLIEWEDD